MPLNHVRSFADLPADELAEAHMILERARGIIETKFGPTIVAEHGPGAPSMERYVSGLGIRHAQYVQSLHRQRSAVARARARRTKR